MVISGCKSRPAPKLDRVDLFRFPLRVGGTVLSVPSEFSDTGHYLSRAQEEITWILWSCSSFDICFDLNAKQGPPKSTSLKYGSYLLTEEAQYAHVQLHGKTAWIRTPLNWPARERVFLQALRSAAAARKFEAQKKYAPHQQRRDHVVAVRTYVRVTHFANPRYALANIFFILIQRDGDIEWGGPRSVHLDLKQLKASPTLKTNYATMHFGKNRAVEQRRDPFFYGELTEEGEERVGD